MLKPIVKIYWREGNVLAMVEAAKQRMREVHLNREVKELEEKLKGVTDYASVIKVISEYCDVR